MITAKDLFEELDHWIFIGTGDDIVQCPDQREEYQHLVRYWRKNGMSDEAIPRAVLLDLKQEAEMPFFIQSTYWRLKYLRLKRRLLRRL